MEQLQSHIWLTASSYMGKYLRISSYFTKPFLIYDFATASLWLSLYMRKILFYFLSVWVAGWAYRQERKGGGDGGGAKSNESKKALSSIYYLILSGWVWWLLTKWYCVTSDNQWQRDSSLRNIHEDNRELLRSEKWGYRQATVVVIPSIFWLMPES